MTDRIRIPLTWVGDHHVIDITPDLARRIAALGVKPGPRPTDLREDGVSLMDIAHAVYPPRTPADAGDAAMRRLGGAISELRLYNGNDQACEANRAHEEVWNIIRGLRAELATVTTRKKEAWIKYDDAVKEAERLRAELAAEKERADANAQINNDLVGECREILGFAPGEGITDACRRVMAALAAETERADAAEDSRHLEACATYNTQNEIYDLLFPGESPDLREVRWKWITLKLRKVIQARDTADARVAELEKEVAALKSPAVDPLVGPIAWRCTGEGLIEYVSDARYKRFAPEIQEWYEPYHCASCRDTIANMAELELALGEAAKALEQIGSGHLSHMTMAQLARDTLSSFAKPKPDAESLHP